MVALITFPFGILLLLSWIPFGHGFMGNVGKLADVMPNDPTVEVGDTLVLNCTLMPLYNGTQNASNIYFDHNLKNYTYPYVQTLSNITAQLRLPNITSDMHGSYLCRLPGVYLGLGAAQSLYVVRRPLKPVLDGCIISNWEKMECSWSPSRAKQDNHTSGMKTFVQTLFYRHPGDDENWKTCPQNASDKCTWPATQFKMGANYCIQINATNILKHIVTSDVTCVVAQDEIVKPNPPEHVESSFASEFDGHVTLRWDPPTSSYQYEMPLIYQVDVQNQWHNQISNVTTETSMKLPVVPATNYVVQISVRPSRGGFASDKVVKTFVTPATAPCKNPDTQVNAFFLAKESGTVRLYWQPITARDSCGPDLSYEVRARQSDGETNGAGSWRTVSSVASFGNSAEVMLSEGEDEVTIQSKNNIGFASDLPHVVIRVPSSSSKGNSSSNNMYRLVVEGNDNSVMAHWFDTAQPQVENVMGYTLFWCQRQSFNHICKTPIQWKNLNRAESEYNLTLSDNYLHFQIGLAVNYLSGSTSGITWADKLYSQTAKAEAPRILEVVTPYLGYHGEIDISWTTTPCTVPCAYVHTFVISYCLADHQNKCHGETQNISIESWKNFTYNLANLEHGSTYKIWMTSVARTGSSEPSAPIYATTTKSWVTAGAVAGIIIAILCVGTIAIGGLYIILRHCNKCRKKFVDGLNLPVALPPTHRLPIPSTSSEAPMLGKNFEYNRQESVSSGDSGRYSLSPASPATSPLLPKLIDVNENLDSFMPGNFSTMEDVKVDDDNDSTRGCVLSYTLVSNDAPEGESVVPNGFRKSVTTLPNGAAKMGDVRNPGVVSNGDITGHSKYIFPEQIELLGMFPSNPESDVNYCTSFSFARPSTGNASGHSVADIGYTKVENLQPLYDLVDRLPNADADNYQSQDFNGLQSESSQDAESVEQSDLVCTIDQLLATLNADPPLTNDLQTDNPATSSENSEPELSLPPPPPPRPGENDAPFRGYMKIANTDFPSLACDDVEWGADKQSSLTNWGYVDHAMFGVDSIA